MENKKWYTSKMLWVNFLAFIGEIIQGVTGNQILTPELRLQILAGINFLLRFVTKKPVVWE